MSKYTGAEFADKVDWEGGLLDATFGYGLSHTDLEDTQSELYQAMLEFDMWKAEGEAIISRVENLIYDLVDGLDNDEEVE